MTPFWKAKTLEEMTEEEWESLCDGCGKCCCVTLEDEETGEMFPTRVACWLFDSMACACGDYARRFTKVPSCLKVTPQNVRELTFFPESCAYRLVAEGRDLPTWHHLVSADRQAIHRAGRSVRGLTINESDVGEDEYEDHMVIWPGDEV